MLLNAAKTVFPHAGYGNTIDDARVCLMERMVSRLRRACPNALALVEIEMAQRAGQ